MARSRVGGAPHPQAHHLSLAGELTLRGAPDIYGRLREALGAHRHVVADLADDAVVDLSFVQLIESARQTAAAAGAVFTLGAPAAGPLLEVLRRGGFLTDRDPARRDFWTVGGAL